MFSSNSSQVSSAANYIEDVFSTYLYTGVSQPGNGSVFGYLVNNIDLLTKGGMIWTKDRSNNATGTNDNVIVDTLRGTGTWPAGIANSPYMLKPNLTDAQATMSDAIKGVTTTGYYIGGGNTGADAVNTLANNYASWTFREQPKFFDVVTYTGTGSNTTIAHNLGSVPGCIIVKRTDTTAAWAVYHTSLANTEYLVLNTTAAKATGATWWNSTTPTSAVFSVGTDASVNASGGTYVAYIFAHNAGGFGLTGANNVISCGSFTSDASGFFTATLGYEPQWVMYKQTNAADDWRMIDTMRGMTNPYTNGARLLANSSAAEGTGNGFIEPTATGFYGPGTGAASSTYIYIAIRRGPMKVPTLGTSVFTPKTWTGTGATANVTGIGFPSDLWITHGRDIASQPIFDDRLRGAGQDLFPNQTTAETTQTSVTSFASMDGVTFGTDSTVNLATYKYINYAMLRAPSFFDGICYTGTGSNTTITHNLGAVPELIFVKGRSGATAWQVYSSALANTEYVVLNTTAAKATGATRWNSTTPTSSVFSIGTATETNTSAATYVAYLFATCTGVSKVGSYTGTGATQTIACGFGASGARFVLIKRTDSTGDWYVWDSARGMISGTDPSLLLNSNAVEVNANSIYAISTGFQIVSTAAGINASTGTYIFLAIA